MSKLFSCFGQSKNRRDYSQPPPAPRIRGFRAHPRVINELDYVGVGPDVRKQAVNQQRFNGNNVISVYKTDTKCQNSQANKRDATDCKREVDYPANATGHTAQTVAREKSPSREDFIFRDSTKPMIYLMQESERSPLSAGRYVHQMPVQAKKHPPFLTTADGKILRPFSSGHTKRLSVSSGKDNSSLKVEDAKSLEAVEDFPLAQGKEVTVAAPLIGEARRGRGNYIAAPNYDGLYLPPFYFYDGGYGGLFGEYVDGYSYPYRKYKRKRSCCQIYASQTSDTTLPTTSFGQGKETFAANTSESKSSPGTGTSKKHCVRKEENLENVIVQESKGSNIEFISSAQLTDDGKKFDLIYFSPERFFTETASKKLKWRIVIKKDEE